MASSAQITTAILESADPKKTKAEIWARCRYLIAQNPAADNYSETTTGYLDGKMVVPGPLCDRRFGFIEDCENLDKMENQFYIRWTDSATTDNADVSVGQALYTIMTPEQADRYEETLCNEAGLSTLKALAREQLEIPTTSELNATGAGV